MNRVKGKLKNHEDPADSRKQLINEEMRFLLQQNRARFAQQLSARLLEEGCNLPSTLARPLFYEVFTGRLAPRLSASDQVQVSKLLAGDRSNTAHARFYAVVRFMRSHLKDPEKQMVLAGFDAIQSIVRAWRVDETLFTAGAGRFDPFLRQTVDRLIDANSSGRLKKVPFIDIRRRVYMALTTSLLRHGKGYRSFHSAFGSVPMALKSMITDPDMFSRVMAFFFDQIPHAPLIASRTFWRTLQSIDTDR